jgi:two-component system, cell cycle response regulator
LTPHAFYSSRHKIIIIIRWIIDYQGGFIPVFSCAGNQPAQWMGEMENQGKVLLVDDEPLNVKLMETRLTVAGYQVVTAATGEEGLAQAFKTRPDIILLDVMMPGLNGYQVTSQLKADPELKIIPIVLLTALEDAEAKVKGLNAGADDFLSKPVNQLELLARIRSLIKLKRLQEELVKMNRAAQPPDDLQTDIQEIPKKSILIVEDDKMAAVHTTFTLEKAGYRAITAKDGAEARAFLRKEHPALILLDIMLPDINGLDLLREIKEIKSLEHMPVIIVSAVGDLEVRIKGIETGADDYLVKPVNYLEMLARVRANLRKTELSHKLKADLDAAVTQAITDTLTRLYNRNYLNISMEREISAARRYGKGFSLLMIDIDHFKDINDTFGHLTGDSVLQEIGTLLKDTVRAVDIVVRYGGEEFVALLQETGIKGAIAAAEHAREAVEQHRFANVNDAVITVSIGATEFSPSDSGMEMIIARADHAMYQAKQAGRNRVVAIPPGQSD